MLNDAKKQRGAYIVQLLKLIVAYGKDVELRQWIHVLQSCNSIIVQSQIFKFCQAIQPFDHFNIVER